jgi:predicted nucleotidyltransferase component of viral defense system
MEIDYQHERKRSGEYRMISAHEIREQARKIGVPETRIERDYVQNRFLNELYSNTNKLIFKGGTAIRKAYIRDYRFSDDLDFTLANEMSREELIVLIEKTKKDTGKNAGIDFEELFDLVEVTNGWKALLHYRSSLTRNFRIKIKLDITKYNLEKVLLPVEERAIFHNFSDSCKTKLITYSLNEILAEKMRALFDRGWPRDVYDVYMLWDIVNPDVSISLFRKKCEFKGIKTDINTLSMDREQIKGSWDGSLGHQMRDVPDFDSVFTEILTRFEAMMNK